MSEIERRLQRLRKAARVDEHALSLDSPIGEDEAGNLYVTDAGGGRIFLIAQVDAAPQSATPLVP